MGVAFKQGKTNKSYSKRLRVTRRGKILVRKPGKDHFNARSSRSKQLEEKRMAELNIGKKELGRYLPHSNK